VQLHATVAQQHREALGPVASVVIADQDRLILKLRRKVGQLEKLPSIPVAPVATSLPWLFLALLLVIEQHPAPSQYPCAPAKPIWSSQKWYFSQDWRFLFFSYIKLNDQRPKRY
jgi:hypothetical protein